MGTFELYIIFRTDPPPRKMLKNTQTHEGRATPLIVCVYFLPELCVIYLSTPLKYLVPLFIVR